MVQNKCDIVFLEQINDRICAHAVGFATKTRTVVSDAADCYADFTPAKRSAMLFAAERLRSSP